MDSELERLLAEAHQRVAAMSPAERQAMWAAQRQSWVRAFTTPCEHGELDFEQCGECRSDARKSLKDTQ